MHPSRQSCSGLFSDARIALGATQAQDIERQRRDRSPGSVSSPHLLELLLATGH